MKLENELIFKKLLFLLLFMFFSGYIILGVGYSLDVLGIVWISAGFYGLGLERLNLLYR